MSKIAWFCQKYTISLQVNEGSILFLLEKEERA
jgi:hypothetical protein